MPKNAPPAALPSDDLYRIAAVARLTGMPETTIRMWERRYAAVEPARSAGNGRLYSRADIDRLVLLKTAVDAGHAIGTVAGLDDEQLRQRLGDSASSTAVSLPRGECRVLVCGLPLAERLQQAWSGRSDLRITSRLPAPPAEVTPPPGNDVIMVELATLQGTSLRALRQLRAQSQARVMVVVYGFSSRQTLARLDQEGIIAVPTPADPAQLARICQLGLAMDSQPTSAPERRLMQPAAPRRYDEQFLATVARRPSTVRCECPNHLADLLTKLNAFEQYSLECENSDNADAAIHALLYSAASQCRELLELALHRVLEHEGIRDD